MCWDVSHGSEADIWLRQTIKRELTIVKMFVCFSEQSDDTVCYIILYYIYYFFRTVQCLVATNRMQN